MKFVLFTAFLLLTASGLAGEQLYPPAPPQAAAPVIVQAPGVWVYVAPAPRVYVPPPQPVAVSRIRYCTPLRDFLFGTHRVWYAPIYQVPIQE